MKSKKDFSKLDLIENDIEMQLENSNDNKLSIRKLNSSRKTFKIRRKYILL